jgi:hypothetical protein
MVADAFMLVPSYTNNQQRDPERAALSQLAQAPGLEWLQVPGLEQNLQQGFALYCGMPPVPVLVGTLRLLLVAINYVLVT